VKVRNTRRLKHKSTRCRLARAVVQFSEASWYDATVAEMAEQHDVREILQLARKYVDSVQEMIYGE